MIEFFEIFKDAYMNNSAHYFLSLLLYTSTLLVAIFLFIISFIYRRKLEFVKIMFFIYTILIPLYMFFAISYILKLDFVYYTSLGYFLGGVINTLLLTTDCVLLRYIIFKFNHTDEEIILKYKEENTELFKENELMRNRITYLESKIKRLEK